MTDRKRGREASPSTALPNFQTARNDRLLRRAPPYQPRPAPKQPDSLNKAERGYDAALAELIEAQTAIGSLGRFDPRREDALLRLNDAHRDVGLFKRWLAGQREHQALRSFSLQAMRGLLDIIDRVTEAGVAITEAEQDLVDRAAGWVAERTGDAPADDE